MNWPEIRNLFPEQWLVVEALEAHSTPEHYRVPDRLSVVEKCENGTIALKNCHQLNKHHPNREFYFLHTNREEINIKEHYWVGIQRNRNLNTEVL